MSEAAAAGAVRAVPAMPAAEDPPQRTHLRRQQMSLLARQWTRSPFAIAIACVFVAYTVRGHAPLPLVLGWALALIGLVFARLPYAQRLVRDPPGDAERTLRFMVCIALVNGALTGAAAPLFFPALPLEERTILTMILVCWTAGGVATAAAYAPAFYAYVTPALLPLAAFWATSGNAESMVLAALIVVFGLLQAFFVRDNQRVVHESFLIRYENERLLEALERERQAVLLARDRAEAANYAKSRFLAAASHDLRQPLHALSLYSAALKVRAQNGPAGEIAEHIGRALAALSALVDSLLDISKLDAGVVQPSLERFNVKTLIERVAGDYRHVAREKRLEFRVATADAEVESDPVLLERVARNLLDNAFKYTVAGGVTLSAERGETTVRIVVHDSGPGIPAAERERIFEEFYQIGNPERDRSQGLGLGLAIVRRLARLLNVEVELQSDFGRGSMFSLTLPCYAETAAAAACEPGAALEAQPGGLDGASVLVIDDERDVRHGMCAVLEPWGCRVAACGSLDEAERMLDREAMTVDLIIADFRLRQHENGIETVRRLRGRLGQVPALLISGDTAPERLREAQASGLPLLHKPVSEDRLRQAMVAALRR